MSKMTPSPSRQCNAFARERTPGSADCLTMHPANGGDAGLARLVREAGNKALRRLNRSSGRSASASSARSAENWPARARLLSLASESRTPAPRSGADAAVPSPLRRTYRPSAAVLTSTSARMPSYGSTANSTTWNWTAARCGYTQLAARFQVRRTLEPSGPLGLLDCCRANGRTANMCRPAPRTALFTTFAEAFATHRRRDLAGLRGGDSGPPEGGGKKARVKTGHKRMTFHPPGCGWPVLRVRRIVGTDDLVFPGQYQM